MKEVLIHIAKEAGAEFAKGLAQIVVEALKKRLESKDPATEDERHPSP